MITVTVDSNKNWSSFQEGGSKMPQTPGNSSSIFFPDSFENVMARSPQGRSPSPGRVYIKVNPATPEDNDKKKKGRPGRGGNASRNANAKGKGVRLSRRDSHDLAREQFMYQIHSFEYDRELIRRQQAMIAVQPLTGLEEIDFKRGQLRRKVEDRKRAEVFSRMSSRERATMPLGSPLRTTPVKSQPGSRSTSPFRLPPTPTPEPKKSEFARARELADSTSKAVRVTKKVSNSTKKLTPKV